MADSTNVINFIPAPTVKKFIKDFLPAELFYDWIVGPVGSGKTTGLFFKLCYMASLQEPGADGIRRTKAVIVRNTAPQLNDTTIASWDYWFKDGQAGKWMATAKNFLLRFGDVECLVLFRPLDTPADIQRVLSLEVTFVIVDEFVQIPREVIEALSGRIGRYPSRAATGVSATNYGMWGASNPSTEDNWWFDYLHHNLPPNANFFTQPSGLSPEAENLTGLNRENYYTDLIKGKTDVWIKQFVECEWGFSITGKPVISSFRAPLHTTPLPLRPNPALPLVVGFDPGLAGSALVFGQQDVEGRLLIFGELIQSNMGVGRVVTERLKPYLRRRFPNISRIIIAPDPAAANRSQSDEKTVVQMIEKHFPVSIETNNRLPLRIDALDHFCNKLIDGRPALLIDSKECPNVIRALKGGWRWAMDTKKDIIRGAEPEKNPYSHAGDAAGYLARYFHKIYEQELRYSGVGQFKPPRIFGPSYHQR